MLRTITIVRLFEAIHVERLLFVLLIALTALSTTQAQSALDGFDPNANGLIRTIVVQENGKILIGGDFSTLAPNGGAPVTRIGIARLNPDGTLDAAFNPNANSFVVSIAVQTDGKILVGGGFSSIGGQTRNYIARLDASTGAADSFNPNANNTVDSIAVQADGKILVGGTFTTIGGQARNNIARLDASTGAADSFDPNANNFVVSIAVQADGKILAGGFFTSIGGLTRNRIARLNTDGTLDSAFNPNANNLVFSIAVQADGKILVGGNFTGANSIGGQTRNYIARLDTTTGLADSFNPNANSSVRAIAVQTDGKILVGGFFTSIGGQTRNRMARLDASTGTADSFDPNVSAYVDAIAVQADGKVLAAGNFTTVGGQTRNYIARLETDGRLDRTLDINTVGSVVSGTAIQPDGKVVIGGIFSTVLGVARNNIARLNSDGTLDLSFDPNANGDVRTIAIQADGKVLVGGSFTTIGGQSRNSVARLDAVTGAADSFDPNANNSVNSIAIQADGKIVVGGFFTSIGQQLRNCIARLDATTGLADSFNPNANDVVTTIVIQADGKILAGGRFSVLFGTPTIGGQNRNRIARLDPVSGLADSFNPNANDWVDSISVQPDGKILAAGLFTIIGGQTRTYIARLDANTGLADSFAPNANTNVDVIAIQADGKILAGGAFTTIGGQTRNHIARLDAVTGLADSFNPNANGTVGSITVQTDGKILAGGNFVSIGGQSRSIFARLTNDTAALQNLAVTQTSVTWTRGGSSPRLTRVTFESSPDNLNYTPLGNGTPAGGNWELTGLNLPINQNIYIRARGYYRSGFHHDCESIAESVRNVFFAGPLNAITSFDAALIAQHFVNPFLTGNKLPAADTFATCSVNFTDAIIVNQYVANSGSVGTTGTTIGPPGPCPNLPATVPVLKGDVSGTAPITTGGSGTANVSLPVLSGSTGGFITTVPITVSDLTGLGVISYEFQVTFDPSVISPAGPPIETTGTLSNGWNVLSNSSNPGHLIVSGFFSGTPLTGSGTLLNLRFGVNGTPGQSTALTFENYTDTGGNGSHIHQSFLFNEGIPTLSLTNGSLTIVMATPTNTPTNTPTATATATPATVVLYDQYNNQGPVSIISTNIPDSPALSSQIADDFVVPVGQTWTIQMVEANGVYFSGPGPAISFDISFYTDSATLPGTVVANRLAQPFTNTSGNFAISFSTPVVLTPGTYWVSVVANMPSSNGRWGWRDRTIQFFSGAAWQNPGGGFASCLTWGRRGPCVGDPTSPDQIFRLSGTNAFSPNCVPITLEFGNTITGNLNSGSCVSGGPTDIYAFSGTAGQNIAISMDALSAGGVQPVLQLLNAGGTNSVASNSGTLNARIPSVGFFTLPTTDVYTILASSPPGAFGLYSLSLTLQPAGPGSCNYAVSPAVTNVSPGGGMFFFDVLSGVGCPTVTAATGANSGHITIVTNSGGRVTFSVAAHGGTTDRSGTIIVNNGEATHTITQFGILPPDNDLFAQAQTLTPSPTPFAPITVNGRNTNASFEANEPAHAGSTAARSVWYRWTAPTSDLYSFTTSGSDFDTVMAIYTGPSVSNLTLIAGNDDTTTFDQTSKINFRATAGTVYSIAIDGANGSSGSIVLNYRQYSRLYRLYLQNFNGFPTSIIPTSVTAIRLDGQGPTINGTFVSLGVYEFDLPDDNLPYVVTISGPNGITWQPSTYLIEGVSGESMPGPSPTPMPGGQNQTSNPTNTIPQHFLGFVHGISTLEPTPSLSVQIASTGSSSAVPPMQCGPPTVGTSPLVLAPGGPGGVRVRYDCLAQPNTTHQIVPNRPQTAFQFLVQPLPQTVINSFHTATSSEAITATAASTFNIDGQVRDGATGLAGVPIDISNSTGIITTRVTSGTNGIYLAQNLAPGDYTLRAASSNYVFLPEMVTLTSAHVTRDIPAVPCSYLFTGDGNFTGFGGQGQFAVTQQISGLAAVIGTQCTWAADRGSNWVSVLSSSNLGNGNVQFSVKPNPEQVPRQTTINVGGQGFVITQEAGFPVTGTITYGNTPSGSPTPRFVSNVLINGVGSFGVSTVSGFPDGAYSLAGFGSGAYTVTPSKTGSVNGAISSFDAGRIALHVAGITTLTGNSRIVADVSGNGTISSLDAGMIAKFVVGPPYIAPGIGQTARWKFSPVSRSYASVNTSISGQDYSVLLMGEVSGNWTNTGSSSVIRGDNGSTANGPERSLGVSVPRLKSSAGEDIIIPISVEGAVNKGIIAYEFDLRYDPSVIQPRENPIDLNGTLSRGLTSVSNTNEPGLLRVVVYGAMPINSNGILLNLRFTAVGSAGSVSPLTWERIMFNEDGPGTNATDGLIEILAATD